MYLYAEKIHNVISAFTQTVLYNHRTIGAMMEHYDFMQTVLCNLREIGAIMEHSGNDDAGIETGLYGHATQRQIMEESFGCPPILL